MRVRPDRTAWVRSRRFVARNEHSGAASARGVPEEFSEGLYLGGDPRVLILQRSGAGPDPGFAGVWVWVLVEGVG